MRKNAVKNWKLILICSSAGKERAAIGLVGWELSSQYVELMDALREV